MGCILGARRDLHSGAINPGGSLNLFTQLLAFVIRIWMRLICYAHATDNAGGFSTSCHRIDSSQQYSNRYPEFRTDASSLTYAQSTHVEIYIGAEIRAGIYTMVVVIPSKTCNDGMRLVYSIWPRLFILVYREMSCVTECFGTGSL
jgi:hypothetical protein